MLLLRKAWRHIVQFRVRFSEKILIMAESLEGPPAKRIKTQEEEEGNGVEEDKQSLLVLIIN